MAQSTEERVADVKWGLGSVYIGPIDVTSARNAVDEVIRKVAEEHGYDPAYKWGVQYNKKPVMMVSQFDGELVPTTFSVEKNGVRTTEVKTASDPLAKTLTYHFADKRLLCALVGLDEDGKAEFVTERDLAYLPTWLVRPEKYSNIFLALGLQQRYVDFGALPTVYGTHPFLAPPSIAGTQYAIEPPRRDEDIIRESGATPWWIDDEVEDGNVVLEATDYNAIARAEFNPAPYDWDGHKYVTRQRAPVPITIPMTESESHARTLAADPNQGKDIFRTKFSVRYDFQLLPVKGVSDRTVILRPVFSDRIYPTDPASLYVNLPLNQLSRRAAEFGQIESQYADVERQSVTVTYVEPHSAWLAYNLKAEGMTVGSVPMSRMQATSSRGGGAGGDSWRSRGGPQSQGRGAAPSRGGRGGSGGGQQGRGQRDTFGRWR